MGVEVSSYKIISFYGHDPNLSPYRALIFSDFMKSLRFGNDWFKLTDSDAYYGAYHRVIEILLTRHDALVRLAVFTDEPDTCLGWSLSEGKTLHYVYVKKDAQNKGIGTALLPRDFNRITHLTKAGLSIWNNKYPEARFDPFL